MTTMLERVAEAQYGVLREQAAGRLPPWAGLDDHARSLMLKQVRAGFEAVANHTNSELITRCLLHAGTLTADNWHTEAATLSEAADALLLAEAPK